MPTEVPKLKKAFAKAILWLLFLLVVATGSTYAWFTLSGRSSTNVTPVGGTVSKGGTVLLISTNHNGSFDKTCNLVLTGNPDTLSPLSTADLQHFFEATAQNKKGISVQYANADTTVNQKALHGTVYLKCENAACDVYFNKEELRLGTDAQALAALRLGMKITSAGGTKTYIWKLDTLGNTKGAASVQTVPKANTVVSSVTKAGQANYVNDPGQDLAAYMAQPGTSDNTFTAGKEMLVSLKADEIATVEYWLYLEGCDAQCSNAVQKKNSEIQLAFAGVDAQEGADGR